MITLKHTLFLLLIFFIISCKKKDAELIEASENEVIEVYNFAELEPLLNRDDATTYVINFWATWCAPCIKELPYFEAIKANYNDENIKVVLVSLDFPDKLESQLIPFVKKRNIKSQVILLDDPDENTWIPKVNESWSGALPATLIYTKDKSAFYEQSFTKEQLFKELETFIKP
tara:strand:+ start:383225 stop:383743 length:519 start_codon:yes stop_codon:yes gene_type:complete